MDVEERTCKLKSLLEEIKVNRECASRQYDVGGLTDIQLATVAWDAVKHNLVELDKSLAARIRLAYMEVWRYNHIPSGEIKDLLPDGSPLEELMQEMALRAKIALGLAERDLSAYLAE